MQVVGTCPGCGSPVMGIRGPWWSTAPPPPDQCVGCGRTPPASPPVFVLPDPSRETLAAARAALQKWVDRQGHARCWYYPEVFLELCRILGVMPSQAPELPPRTEFERGCRQYQREQYQCVHGNEIGDCIRCVGSVPAHTGP